MRIDAEDQIAGHPSMLIRKLLQRGISREWGTGLAEEVLDVSSGEAVRILQDLARGGFIKPEDIGEGEWSNTVKGNALAFATAARPIRRATADRVVQEFLARVREVNNDTYYLFAVNYAVVFGSYLREAPTVNDVDIAIELIPKEPDREVRSRLEDERVALALRSGRHFSNYVQEIRWPRTEVWLRLKARSRTLSLHDLEGDAQIIKKDRFEVLFSSTRDCPVPAVLQD